MVNYKEIYLKYLAIFKEKIKDQYIPKIFLESDKEGIDLKRIHTKHNQDPEALTVDIIREMLRECKIDVLDITRELTIEGTSLNVFKKVVKKPDFLIESSDPNTNSILFEIEHLNKDLNKSGSGEGIEQAREWYNIKPSLVLHYDSIITNFIQWYMLRFDLDKENFTLSKIEPWEMLEIITDRKFGLGKEYILEDLEVKKHEITNKFYNGFQERLKKLLKRTSKIEFDIYIENYKRAKEQTDEQVEKVSISYYRTIFSRLLFIKILESWKMLPLDPIKKILEEDKRFWNEELRNLFFKIFNQNKKDRPVDLPDYFKDLPYLNGGLFRPSGIEIDEIGTLRNIGLNPEAIKDIWDFFKEYNFLKEKGSNENSNSHTINPEILGYIFERSIGDERKLTGSYYTREELTNYMVENTLYPYIVDQINKFLDKLKIKKILKITDIDFLENSKEVYEYLLNSILENIKICDPACGSGAFLEKAAEKLLFLYSKCFKEFKRKIPYILGEGKAKDSQMPFPDIFSIKKHIIQKNIYGVDINPSAIEICELRLWLWVIKLPENIEFSSLEFEIPPLPTIEYNLRCGNSLIGYRDFKYNNTQRIDQFVFYDFLNKKQELIKKYYEKEKFMDESEKDNSRTEINRLIKALNGDLNKYLLKDYQKRNISILADTLYVPDYQKEKDYKKIIFDKISYLNKNFILTKFRINIKNPTEIDLENIKNIKGLSSTKVSKSNKIKSIYTTNNFNFGYYTEYGENPLSKLIFSLIKNWDNINSIEFHKKLNEMDLDIVNPFHWFMEFSEIFNIKTKESNGFDIIIGNPPFIRIENIDEPLRELYKNDFELAEKRFDIFILFYEICKSLIKEQGYICLISSNKFLKSQTAQNMRKFIRSNFSIREILNFNNYNAFPGVTIKTLLFFMKRTNEKIIFPYISINDQKFSISIPSMQLIEKSKTSEYFHELFSVYQIKETEMDEIDWDFYPVSIRSIIKKIECINCKSLEEFIIYNRQGVVTAANDIFIVNEEVIQRYNIESEFIYKIVKGEELRRWNKILWDNTFLIYPYRVDPKSKKREKLDLEKDQELNIVKYLFSKKELLECRYCVTSGNKDWFELHDPVSPEYFLSKKIMFPDISLVPSFTVDLTGELFSLDTNYSIIPKKEDFLYYLVAILNAFVLEIYVRFKFQTLARELRYKTFLVNKLPIMDPDLINKDIFDSIINKSKNLLENYDKDLEMELNMLIKDLYNITDEEYKIILEYLNIKERFN